MSDVPPLKRRRQSEPNIAEESKDSSDDHGKNSLPQQKKVSCLTCRDAKVKCIPSAAEGDPCVRCAKLAKECIFMTHKRGRKPGKIKLQQIQRRLKILDRTLLEIQQLNQDVKDPDAESLVKTLTWQLHRSKFFSSGIKPQWRKQSVSPAISPQSYESDQAEAGPSDRARPLDRLQYRSKSLSAPSLLGPTRNATTRARPDFNMLVDMEDHDSVSRVRDEFHTLSNPLKLLAQASDESRQPRASTSQLPAPPISTTPQTWSNTYFSRGAFHPVYDNRPEFDPIDGSLLSVQEAERLIGAFYQHFGTFIHIFDPNLSTITYIRKHSAFLLTVMCAISAEFERDQERLQSSAELAKSLRRHAEEMMPAIVCGDYKNVEMAQAFFLLAWYQPISDSAMSDQTWSYLGNAIRIATELGCNLCCYSYQTPKVHQQEHYKRQLRNTERLWINLWTFEKTLSSQTGQRFHLSEDGVIATCSSWHRQDFALPQDEALIASVELRRIMASHSDTFNTHILRSLTARKNVRLSQAETHQLHLQLEFFRTSVDMDLKRWEERWLSTTEHTPLQVTGALFLDYAAVVTYSLPLPIRYSVDVEKEMESLYRHCYDASTRYMSRFADRCQRGLMDYIPNSFIISAVYCAVFALDLCRRAPHLSFTSPLAVETLCRNVSTHLHQIGTAHKNRIGRSLASKYSDFLAAVLDRQPSGTEASRWHSNALHFQNVVPPPVPALEDLTALDRSWNWMMSDLSFFQLDGGDPIMDQMGRLFS